MWNPWQGMSCFRENWAIALKPSQLVGQFSELSGGFEECVVYWYGLVDI